MSSRISIVAFTLACASLASMPACDSACEGKSASYAYRKRQYQRALIEEFCIPGTFYMECIWHRQDLCHLEMPMHVNYCVEPPQRPGETHRVLRCVLLSHYPLAATKDELRAECLDASRWEHVTAANASTLAAIHRTWKRLMSPSAIPGADEPEANDAGENDSIPE